MFKVGDQVAFKNRVQRYMGGMTVQAVDTNMFDTLIMVDGQWWVPECFIPFEEWNRG